MKVHCSNIEYDVADYELDFAEECKEPIVMPTELDLEIDDEDWNEFKDDIDEYIADVISEQTGWLVKAFTYEAIQ